MGGTGEGEAKRSFVTMVVEDDDLDLGEAALAIAELEFPGLDRAAYGARLDALAREALALAGPHADPRGKLQALTRTLFIEHGLRGNLEDYYSQHNSYVNRVLDTGLGSPISLSIVTLEVGRRMGLPLVGVGLPGHFLVKLAGADEEVLIDPFYRGVVLTLADCQRRLDTIYAGKVVLTEAFLRAVSKREILLRMLYNLKRIHTRAGDTRRSLAVLELILALQPFALEDLRDRGMLRYRACQYDAAAEDLRAYLGVFPGARDAAECRRVIEACDRARPQHR